MNPESRLVERIGRDIKEGGESSIPVAVLAAVFADGDKSRLKLDELKNFAAGHGWMSARAVGGSLTFRPAGGGG